MIKLILYSTLGCHLCDLALDEIEPCLSNTSWVLEKVDIADDPDLLKQYGTSIPVLFFPAVDSRLYWPFDCLAVKQFLTNK
jgi:hypothetical protein